MTRHEAKKTIHAIQCELYEVKRLGLIPTSQDAHDLREKLMELAEGFPGSAIESSAINTRGYLKDYL